MSIGAGIASQIGIAQEVTPGTPVTPSRFYEYDSETLSLKRKVMQGGGLRPDKTYDRASRRYVTQRDVQGDISLDFPTKGAGLLLANMLGSFATVATQLAATAAWRQVHVPGPFTGKALTIQKGVPRTDGTVEAYTYPGCKITTWQLDCAQSDLLKLKVSVDAMDELTTASTPAGLALGTASYSAAQGDFTFVQGALLSGGTPSTAAGVTTISGGTPVAGVNSVSIMGSAPVNNSRFFLGSATKAEQIQNAYATITGSMVCEFTNRALYDQYRADASAAISLTFTGPIIAAANAYTLQILMPVAFLEDGASPAVGSADIVTQTIPFTGLDDGTNPPMQIIYITTDVAV